MVHEFYDGCPSSKIEDEYDDRLVEGKLRLRRISAAIAVSTTHPAWLIGYRCKDVLASLQSPELQYSFKTAREIQSRPTGIGVDIADAEHG